MKNFFLQDELSKKEMSCEFSKFHILPVPLEKTVSYGFGTSRAPANIIYASNQLERTYNDPCDYGIYTHDELDCSLSFNEIFHTLEEVIYGISSQNKIPIMWIVDYHFRHPISSYILNIMHPKSVLQ